MIELNALIKKIINEYKKYNVIDCCYIEKAIENDKELVFIYFVPLNENTNFYSIFEKHKELDIMEIIEEETSIIYSKVYNWDKTIQVLTCDNYCLYFNIVHGIYLFPKVEILFKNVDTLKRLDEREMNLVNSIDAFTFNLNILYRMIQSNNKYLGLKYCHDAYSSILMFLANFYCNYSFDSVLFHIDFNDVLNKMDKRKQVEFTRIIEMMKIDNLNECAKLMLWFFNDYLTKLTISVVSKINIDYYDFVKGLYITR